MWEQTPKAVAASDGKNESPLLLLPLVFRPVYSTFWILSLIKWPKIYCIVKDGDLLRVSSLSLCPRHIFKKLFYCFVDLQILGGVVYNRTSESHGYVPTTHNLDLMQCDMGSCVRILNILQTSDNGTDCKWILPSQAPDELRAIVHILVQPGETQKLKTQLIHTQTVNLQKLWDNKCVLF